VHSSLGSRTHTRLILDFAEEFFPVPRGEFMSRAHPTEAPFSPPPLPGVSETNQMTYCWLSECMAYTSDDVYEKASTFKHTLTLENVKVGSTGVCYREVLYCVGPTVCMYSMSMYSKCHRRMCGEGTCM